MYEVHMFFVVVVVTAAAAVVVVVVLLLLPLYNQHHSFDDSVVILYSGVWHVRPKNLILILSKSGDDEVGVVGLDKRDLGWGRGWEWGKGLVELDERGEPGLDVIVIFLFWSNFFFLLHTQKVLIVVIVLVLFRVTVLLDIT